MLIRRSSVALQYPAPVEATSQRLSTEKTVREEEAAGASEAEGQKSN